MYSYEHHDNCTSPGSVRKHHMFKEWTQMHTHEAYTPENMLFGPQAGAARLEAT